MTKVHRNKSTKRVLFVSLAFPPLPTVGVYRVSKFCKYLPEMGFSPFVLTEKIKNNVQHDWATLEDIGKKVVIKRTCNFQPFLWWDNRHQVGASPAQTQAGSKPAGTVASPAPKKTSSLAPKRILRRGLRRLRQTVTVPDARLAWIPQGLFPGLRLVRSEKIDVIVSSSPGPTNHVMAHLLSRFSGRPHVVDYRDLWTVSGSYFKRNLPSFLQTWDTFWERMILKHCRGVVVATNTFKENLTAGFEDLDIASKITVIYNGVDLEDYRDTNATIPRNDHFTISYFGNLYGFRNPTDFFQAVAKWIEQQPAVRERVRIDFWGSHDSGYGSEVSAYHLSDVVTFNSRIPQREAMSKMIATDLLLLIQGTDPRAGDAIPTKLFEYFATGKPVLAFFPEGEAADLIRGNSNHLVVSRPGPDSIVDYLQHQYAQWEKSPEYREVSVVIPELFSRRYQAKQLADFLTAVVEAQR